MNPILSDDTDFKFELDRRERARIQFSLRKQHVVFEMVRITTRNNFSLTMTPETLFSLCKRDGAPILRSTVPRHTLPPLNFDPSIYAISTRDDERFWYLAGLVFMAGKFSDDTRPARIHLPVAREWELTHLKGFLEGVQSRTNARNGHRQVLEVKITRAGPLVTLTSRVIDRILESLTLVQHSSYRNPARFPVENEFNLLTNAELISPETHAAFMAGILAGSEIVPEGRKIAHTNSNVVMMLHTFLKEFGIPTEVKINPYEPVILPQKRRTLHIHHLILYREHYTKVQAAGLAFWDRDLLFDGGKQSGLDLFTDPILKIEPAGVQRGFEVKGPGVGTFNGFVLDLNFTPNEIAMDIASMEELFADVSDPAAVIAAAPAHLTHVHGAV
jgi:hypothetical protein